METKEEGLDYLDDLQDWQKEILNSVQGIDIDNLFKEEREIPLTQSQKDMLEKVLGDDFYIQDEKVREVLKVVLELGFYYERDRKVLNLARDCYLKGKNWIKRSYR
jgi:hypothetical protein